MDISVQSINQENFEQFGEVFKETLCTEFPEYSQNIREYFVNVVFPRETAIEKIRIGVFDRKTLVGYLLAEKPFGGVIFINWLAVLKAYQRKGLGTILLKEIENIARTKGAHSIQLQAVARNLDFYKSKGFEVIGLDAKGYFGTDNYILKKLIQEPSEKNFLI